MSLAFSFGKKKKKTNKLKITMCLYGNNNVVNNGQYLFLYAFCLGPLLC